LLAGSVFTAAALCAFIAARNRPGPAMWIVAGVALTFTAIHGWPWLQSAVTDPSSNMIQFGEYLTIPGQIGTVLLGALLVLPFLIGSVWAARRATAA
jgi:biotin transporter BioY